MRKPKLEATVKEVVRKEKMDKCRCPFCRPHKNENESRKGVHGTQKSKRKNKRRTHA